MGIQLRFGALRLEVLGSNPAPSAVHVGTLGKSFTRVVACSASAC